MAGSGQTSGFAGESASIHLSHFFGCPGNRDMPTGQSKHSTQKRLTRGTGRRPNWAFHVDPALATGTFYKGLVASTVHLFAISVKLTHTATDTYAAIASMGITDPINHAPAYSGDHIECRCAFIEKRKSNSKPGYAVVKAKSELFNQRNELIFSYVSTALYKIRGAIDRA